MRIIEICPRQGYAHFELEKYVDLVVSTEYKILRHEFYLIEDNKLVHNIYAKSNNKLLSKTLFRIEN